MKTITFIGINYYPEDTAIGIYSTQMLAYLSQKGYKINVLTGFPYYPEWKIKKSYQNKPKYYNEVINNINVYRYKQYVPNSPSFLKRIIHLLDFTYGTFINSFKIKQTDLVIAVVPFTSTILLGWFLKKRLKAKLWTHIQDFEFDAAQQAGISKKQNNLLFKILFKLEKNLLNKSDIVSTISNTMLAKLKTKTKTESYFFPNWIDKDIISPLKSKQHIYLSNNKFKILYSGNIGDKQNWKFYIDYVNSFKGIDNIEFIIVGDGSKKRDLLNEIISKKEVKYYNPVPYNELSDLLCSADLHVLFQKNNVIDTVMPSKLLGMMASSVPSIVTGNLDSEVSKMFRQNKVGFYFNSNNLKDVVTVTKKLKEDRKLSIQLGENSRVFVVKEFSREMILSKFENKIKEVLNNKTLKNR